MSLTLIAVAAAVAASLGYLAARRSRESIKIDVEQRDDIERKGLEQDEVQIFDKLVLQLGDVVQAGNEERWLCGAVVACENESTVLVLFTAPEGATQAAVAVFPAPRTDIYWLHPMEVACPAEPPSTLEFAGAVMRRKGRFPVTLSRMGQGPPKLGNAGIVAMYEGGGADVAVVLASERQVYGWAGRRLEQHDYDCMGAGGLE